MTFFKSLSMSVIGSCFLLYAAPGAHIVAVVNKDSITQTDLESRVKLAMLTSGATASGKELQNLRQQVLMALIDESLQISAAHSKKVEIDDKEVADALASMAKDNGMTVDQMLAMLKSKGITKETMTQRLKAQLSWVRYVRTLYGFLANVSDIEVDEALKKMNGQQKQKQYALSEITLIVPSSAQEGRVRADAVQLVQQIKSGAPFHAIARQFSQSPSGLSGGDLGWVTAEQMDPAVLSVIQGLSVGQVSAPIRTSSGYKIIALRSVKNPGEADPNETKVSVCQAVFDLTPETPEAVMQIVGPQIEELMATKGCAAFKQVSAKYQLKVDNASEVALGQLPDQLRNVVKKTPVGQTIQPVMTPQGLIVTMICSRKTAVWTPPTREEVSVMIEQEKLAGHATKEMNKIRATAFVDIKDPVLAAVWRQ